MKDYNEFKSLMDSYFDSLSTEELMEFIDEYNSIENDGIRVDEYLHFYEDPTFGYVQLENVKDYASISDTSENYEANHSSAIHEQPQNT